MNKMDRECTQGLIVLMGFKNYLFVKHNDTPKPLVFSTVGHVQVDSGCSGIEPPKYSPVTFKHQHHG